METDMTPQGYELWLADTDDGTIDAGRVIGWWPAPSNSDHDLLPVAAYEYDDGSTFVCRVQDGTAYFLGATREAALWAAMQAVAATKSGTNA